MKKLEKIELEDSLDTTSSSLETVVEIEDTDRENEEIEDNKLSPSLDTVLEMEEEKTEPEPAKLKPAQSNQPLFI